MEFMHVQRWMLKKGMRVECVGGDGGPTVEDLQVQAFWAARHSGAL